MPQQAGRVVGLARPKRAASTPVVLPGTPGHAPPLPGEDLTRSTIGEQVSVRHCDTLRGSYA